MMKVYLEGRLPGWTMHSLYDSLVTDPPEGVEFVGYRSNSSTGNGSMIRSVDRYISSNERLRSILRFVKPSAYYAAYRLLSRMGSDLEADLIYSSQHPIFEPVPWVVDLESAAALVGYGRLGGYRTILENAFASESCGRIMPWTDAGRATLSKYLDCGRFEDKIETVHLAVPPRKPTRRNHGDDVRLLFVGTGNAFNLRGSFEMKGGRELVLAFKKLRERYENAQLTIRSWVPPQYLETCTRAGIRIVSTRLSFVELSREFMDADIFVFPGHTTPGMVILDAMSFGLPVVATDVWANREMVLDGETGFLTKASRFARYDGGNVLSGWGEPSFRSIDRIDMEMVDSIVTKVSVLIENPDIRRRMGQRGIQEIETGKFSLLERNRKLGRIFRESGGFP